MLKGVFPRGLAWLGLATGAIGIASEALSSMLGWAHAIYGLVVLVWLGWLAWELWRLAARPESGWPQVIAGSPSE
jgi:hypothetical protein